MKSVLKNISVLAALVLVVYLVANYAETAQIRLITFLHLPETSVKGISTERAHELSDKFKSDLGAQLGLLENQVLNFTLGDAITTVSRLQKVPQDIESIKSYTEAQINNVVQSRKSN